ncbi:hypothetical protein [Chlorobium phaeobacteroides]|uniref:hypothetical protein n=1 Tax=Chlorobium phaeobacteroides TaxID=1096 RepID=UPI00059D17DD|nr:hypothetical protein [Chlorobium phaeobacteroides]
MSPELGGRKGREERSLPMVEMTGGEWHPEQLPAVIPNYPPCHPERREGSHRDGGGASGGKGKDVSAES